MTTATPTRRAAAISELWDDDDRLVGATQYLYDGLRNAASELAGHLLYPGASSQPDDAWVADVIEQVELVGVTVAREAMIEKMSELIDAAPRSLLEHNASATLRELRAVER